MPSKRMAEGLIYLMTLMTIEHLRAKYGEGLLARKHFEELAQAQYDRDFWDLVGASGE